MASVKVAMRIKNNCKIIFILNLHEKGELTLEKLRKTESMKTELRLHPNIIAIIY